MHILIRLNVAPFASVTEAAASEQQVDWRRDEPSARACTLAYAAQELRAHLRHIARVAEPGLRVDFATSEDGRPADLEIVLAVRDQLAGTPWARPAAAQTFVTPEAFLVRAVRHAGRQGILITAPSRQGVLYGAYRYLTWLGFRWVHKDEPLGSLEYTGRLWSPALRLAEGPAFAVRGLLAEGARDARLATWGARNAFNLLEARPEDSAFLKKLGYQVFAGGHVMETVFDPDRAGPGGKPIFEERPEWFALRDGKRLRRKGYVCLADPKAMAYMLDGLLADVRAKAQAMPLDSYKFWGADTWGAWCECKHCLAMGNSTDRYLRLVAGLRRRMDTLREGVIDGRRIALYAEAYEGSYNLEPPSRPLPKGCDDERVFLEYFPINRCYQHHLFDPACRELNRQYAWALDAWLKGPMGRRLVVGEYYNVSQYYDLAIGFSRVMDADLKRYRRLGVKGVHYMHVPSAAWGTRTLTQFQFATQLWDPGVDRGAIVEEYLRRRYGRQAPLARRLHEGIERSMACITSITSWSDASLAMVMRRVLGAPIHHKMIYDTLFPADHLKLFRSEVRGRPPAGTSGSLEESVAGLCTAQRLVDRLLATATDPQVRRRLREDRFLVRYTCLTLEFFFALACLWHASKYGGQVRGRFGQVERLARQLARLELPAGSCWKTAEPALARIRMKEVVASMREKRPMLEALAGKPGFGVQSGSLR
jgi:hypothetical protein